MNPVEKAPLVTRSRLLDALKMALASGAGILLGAGVMYLYLKSFSKIGKEINAVVQSINGLKAEVEEMKKNYRLRKRRSVSSIATSRSSDDEVTICRRSLRPESQVDPSSDYTSASEMRRPRSRSKSSNGSTDDDAGSVYEEAVSVISGDEEVSVLTGSTRDDDDDNFRDIVDALLDLPEDLIELIDAVDPMFEGDSEEKSKAFAMLQETLPTFDSHPEFLWRFAKASHMKAKIEGAKGDSERKQDLLVQAHEIAQNGLEIRPDDADVQKWFAITLGSIGDYQGMQERILNGFKFKDHISYAIQLRPDDPTLHYLLGRWCYAVYMLSWWERRAAAALFAEPPTASVDEALRHFLRAEELKPDAWKGNQLMIAKCFVELNDIDAVRRQLSAALATPVVDQDDADAELEILALIDKFGKD